MIFKVTNAYSHSKWPGSETAQQRLGFSLVGGESAQRGLLCAERPLRGGLCDGGRRPLSSGRWPAHGAQPTTDAEGCAQRGH